MFFENVKMIFSSMKISVFQIQFLLMMLDQIIELSNM
jgi:hypothetical protein